MSVCAVRTPLRIDKWVWCESVVTSYVGTACFLVFDCLDIFLIDDAGEGEDKHESQPPEDRNEEDNDESLNDEEANNNYQPDNMNLLVSRMFNVNACRRLHLAKFQEVIFCPRSKVIMTLTTFPWIAWMTLSLKVCLCINFKHSAS